MKYDNNENNNVGLTQTTTIQADSSRPVDETWSVDSTHCPGSDFEKVFTTTSKIYSIS